MTPESPAGFSVAEAEQPIYFGRYVLYRGRVMPLVAGGESNGAPAAAGDGGAGGAGDGGDGASGPIPWDLSSVSEELRPHVEAALKGVEGGVTKRFQEHADFRKQWEPYAGVEGLSEISPEDMARLVAFHQTASDEQQFEQWLRAVAQEFGITGEQPQTPAPGDGEPPDTNAALQKMFDDFTGKLEERFAPIEQFMGTSEASQREQAPRSPTSSVTARRGRTTSASRCCSWLTRTRRRCLSRRRSRRPTRTTCGSAGRLSPSSSIRSRVVPGRP
jgi:hypothetical protein